MKWVLLATLVFAMFLPTLVLADGPVELEGEEIEVGRMTVIRTDVSLLLGESARYDGADYRVVQLLSILVRCEALFPLMVEAERYIPLALVRPGRLPGGEATCHITFLALDHRTGRKPMPDAPGLHSL